jgi:hypothetical protein
MADLGLVMLSRREFALVDARDYARVSEHTWSVHPVDHHFYAASRINGHYVLMHRFVIGVSAKVGIDHANGIGLDNRRGNLRTCEHRENTRNRVKPRGSKNPYKGVWWHEAGNRWMAGITIDGKRKYLGLFKHAVEAAKVYDAAAIEIHGAFAKTNKMLGLLP